MTLARLVFFCIFAVFFASAALAQATEIENSSTKLSASATGSWTIIMKNVGDQSFVFQNNGKIQDITVIENGSDVLGPYQALEFTDSTAPRTIRLQAYTNLPLIQQVVTYTAAAPNNAEAQLQFTTDETGFECFGYYGIFSGPNGCQTEGPWIWRNTTGAAFDRSGASGRTIILSPANHFMRALMVHGYNSGSIGINPEFLQNFAPEPENGTSGTTKNFEFRMLFASGQGANQAFDLWGSAIRKISGTQRIATNYNIITAAIGVMKSQNLPYWYICDPRYGNLEDTMLAVVAEARQKNIPFRWFDQSSSMYKKGPRQDWQDWSGGVYEYIGDPNLYWRSGLVAGPGGAQFKSGLPWFKDATGMDMFVHSRWIDPSSPYLNNPDYAVSGGVATGAAYWDMIADYLELIHAPTLWQDWLGGKAQGLTRADDEKFLSQASERFNSMNAAGKQRNLSLMYCMQFPRHVFQSTLYPNVIGMRGAGDRLTRDKWDTFIYTAQFISALGKLPWTDGFFSTELDNLVFSVLSTGPVGVGDRVGDLSAANLMRAVRPDGIVVRPDSPLHLIDRKYWEDALDQKKYDGQLARPAIAFTKSDFDSYSARYIMAWNRNESLRDFQFNLSEVGLSGRALLFDPLTINVLLPGHPSGARRKKLEDVGGSEPALYDSSQQVIKTVGTSGFTYLVAVPVNKAGIAFLGDTAQFVPLGKERIADVVATDSSIMATILFADGETVRSASFYSEAPLAFSTSQGRILSVQKNGSWYSIQLAPDQGQAIIQAVPAAN